MSSKGRVTILMPALNEESTVIFVIKAYLNHPVVREVIVSDNSSSDRTAQRAHRAGARVITVSPKGYGYTIREGIRHVQSKWIFKIDADFRNPNPAWLDLLLAKAMQSGSSFIKTYWRATHEDRDLVTNMVALPMLKRLYPGLTHIRSPLSGVYLFKKNLFREEDLVPTFALDVQLLVLASKMNIEIEQVEIEPVFHGQRALRHYFQMADDLVHFFLNKKKAN